MNANKTVNLSPNPLQNGSGSIAVRMAVGETNIVAENKKFLAEEGVVLSAFDSSSTSHTRSSNVRRVV